MSQKLAFDTLITVLSCLMPTPSLKKPIDLSQHPAFVLEDTNAFCRVKENLEQKILQFELEKEANEQELLRLSYEILELNGQLNSNKTYQNLPEDCSGLKYGVHKVQIFKQFNPTYTICDDSMIDEGAGDWMLVLQRSRHSNNTLRAWRELVEGYGYIYDDYFIGLEKIYKITRKHKQEALLVFRDKKYETNFAHYRDFSIKRAKEMYALNPLGYCRGSACDEQNQKFGDKHVFDIECRTKSKSDWWDFSCFKNAQIKMFLRPARKRVINYSDFD